MFYTNVRTDHPPSPLPEGRVVLLDQISHGVRVSVGTTANGDLYDKKTVPFLQTDQRISDELQETQARHLVGLTP